MGYSTDDSIVRVDFFKSTGKWYTTEAIKWTGEYKNSLIHKEFAKSLFNALQLDDKTFKYNGMLAVCLEPYHEHAYPLMMQVNDIPYFLYN